MVVKRIGVLSLGVLFACLYGLFGLLIGGFATLISLAGVGLGEDGGAAALLFGAGAIVILPLFYAVLGFLGGILTAFLYNIAAGITGGVELDVTLDHSTRPMRGTALEE